MAVKSPPSPGEEAGGEQDGDVGIGRQQHRESNRLASKDALMAIASPQRLVVGPVNAPLPTAETTATTIRIVPMRSGP